MVTMVAVVIDISLQKVKKPLVEMDLGEESYCALITSDGREIANREDISLASNNSYLDFIKTKEKTYIKSVVEDKNEYLYIFRQLNNTDFSIAARISKNDLLTQIEEIKFITIVMVTIAVVLSVAIFLAIYASISIALRRMQKPLSAAVRGDLTSEVVVKGNYEFSILPIQVKEVLLHTRQIIQDT